MNEIKIKINLIEYYYCCLIFPIGGVVFATFLLIFSLFGEVDLKFINGLIIFYICCISLAIVNFLICFIVSRYTKKYVVFYENYFFINETKETYKYKDIVKCKYYICKWYFIPFYYFYKMQAGGLFEIVTASNEKIEFKILYKDFKKIRNIFKKIEII